MATTWLAPGVPSDYYDSIATVEASHWWHRGVRKITRSLLGSRLDRPARVLDAGCGTGGFLRWLVDTGRFDAPAGTDLSGAALDLSAALVPDADLRQAPLAELPFEDAAFELVFCNDVLQHVPENELERSLLELRRVTAREGTLVVRTNGARRYRRDQADWCVFDPRALRDRLTQAGFCCERVTYANMIGSLAAAATGHSPRAPTTSGHGVPVATGRVRNAIGGWSLALEARYLARPGRSLPYGHTLIAVGRAA